jgi:hypothetical protein
VGKGKESCALVGSSCLIITMKHRGADPPIRKEKQKRGERGGKESERIQKRYEEKQKRLRGAGVS